MFCALICSKGNIRLNCTGSGVPECSRCLPGFAERLFHWAATVMSQRYTLSKML